MEKNQTQNEYKITNIIGESMWDTEALILNRSAMVKLGLDVVASSARSRRRYMSALGKHGEERGSILAGSFLRWRSPHNPDMEVLEWNHMVTWQSLMGFVGRKSKVQGGLCS
ncbi:hypothetical protein PVK06_016551 [Gossypium arboreum]|uniref:Uncharacterized protein n=1 Tax=Gossypium arboreum TaxID=29729 RepID=A0ABR0Q1G4_GOSAR|nr:hypothetical protein PVK06_016551 [Gossypium arboreum]